MNQDSSSMDLDPKVAKNLFDKGAVLIITGIPQKTEFGIDLCSYTIGENFRGVKMIPPGPHYVWCAAVGPYGDTAPRVGFSCFVREQDIIIKEWDLEIEELRDRKVQDRDLEKKRIRENLRTLDAFLAPYDFRYWGEWRKLIDTVTKEALERCQPSLITIRTNVELQSCPDSERPRGPLAEVHPSLTVKLLNDENDLLPHLQPIEGTAPRFCYVPPRVPTNCSPSEVSQHSIDCVEACQEMLKPFELSQDLIQEVQLAFAFYLVGYSVESLAHWRRILSLLSHSQEAIIKHRLLYMKYSEVLGFQLPHLPDELMTSTERNTVYKDVRSLLINLNAMGLHKSSDLLCSKLKAMNWTFEDLLDEDPEDMPVIVE